MLRLWHLVLPSRRINFLCQQFGTEHVGTTPKAKKKYLGGLKKRAKYLEHE